MIFRVIALTLALLIGFGVIIPVATNDTEAGARKPVKSKKKYKKYKKYSKKWWRAYRLRIKKKKALQARKRNLRLRRIRLANAKKSPPPKSLPSVTLRPVSFKNPEIRSENLFILVEGKIKKVIDGDTFTIENRDGKVYTVKMLGINAPEISEDFGEKSQKNLSDLILGKNATVIIRKKDAGERFLGTVYSGGEDINQVQIETGMAVYRREYGNEPGAGDRKTYEQAEQNARLKRKGLWTNQKSNSVAASKD